MEKTKGSTVTAYRRREEIKTCLLEILKYEPYKQLTVMDICRKLGITRKVFYKHFRGKEDCLNYLMDDALLDAQAYTIKNIPHWEMSLSSAIIDMECWKQKSDLLDMIARNNLYKVFLDRAVLIANKEDMVTVQLLTRPEMSCDLDILSSFLGCYFSLIFSWHSRGFDSSTEEMARKFLRLCTAPMFTLL